MADVKSKNLYELLGNTSDQDSDREPDPPTKIADKPVGRSGKRDAPKEAPSESRGGRGGRGGRRGGFTGSEQAFRDQEAGSVTNRGKPVDDGLRQDRHSDRLGGGRQNTAHDGYARGGRGGRGYRGTGGRRGNAAFGDRQNRSGRGDHSKQADQSWGAPTGDGEWQAEREGQADATREEKEAGWDTGAAPPTDNWDPSAAQGAAGWDESAAGAPNWTEDGAPAVDHTAAITEEKEAEPEDKSVSYADYLATQATKKMENLGLKEARKPNEGQKTDKKWSGAKAFNREDEDYMGGKENQSTRRRERKTKEYVTIDQSFKPEPRGGGGTRGRGRGDRGDRGDRSDRGDRPRGGRGEGRGSFRGSRGDGEYRGGRGRGRGRGFGEGGGQVNVDDQSSFPSLGAK